MDFWKESVGEEKTLFFLCNQDVIVSFQLCWLNRVVLCTTEQFCYAYESCATPLRNIAWHQALIKMGIGEPALQPLGHVNNPTPGNTIENYTPILNTKKANNPVIDYFKQLTIKKNQQFLCCKGNFNDPVIFKWE